MECNHEGDRYCNVCKNEKGKRITAISSYKKEVIRVIEETFTEIYGEPCDTKDTDDFPDMDENQSRCPICKHWGVVDDLKRKLEEMEEK